MVTLLSAAATAIALAFAGAAGIFLVRRRSAEASLLYARGERSSVFAARTGLELLLPLAVGTALGFGVALAATARLAPSGSLEGGTLDAALRDAALGAVAALTLAVGAATLAFLRQFDTSARAHPWLRRIPWELPLLAAAGWLLYDLLSGGGLAREAGGAGHPTLAVFVFPLLLVAAVAGLVAACIATCAPGPQRAWRRTADGALPRASTALGSRRRPHGAPRRLRGRFRFVLLRRSGCRVGRQRGVGEGLRRLRRRRAGADRELGAAADESSRTG